MAATDTLLTPADCVMLLVDFQAGLGFGNRNRRGDGNPLRIEPPLPPGRPERHRKIPEPTDNRYRSI